MLSTSHRSYSSTIAWHHNLYALMLGVSSGLKLSEIVLTEHKNSERTEKAWHQANQSIHQVLVFQWSQ